MAYAVVTSLMTTLEQVLQFNPSLISESKLLIDSLYGRLSSLQAFLEDAGKRINDQEALTILEKKIRDAVYKAEDTVDLCLKRIHVADIDSNQDNARRMLYDELQQIGKVMDSIQEELMKFKNENQHIKDLPAINFFPLRSSGHVVDEEYNFVGMENVFNKVLNQLIGGNARELNVVSVVGMGGIGKSTLAGSIFRNTSVFCHFDVSSWVTVSQEYDVREMLLDVLSFGTPSLKAMYSNLSNDQLLEQVYRKLKGKRYLIVLDDIWSIEAWNLVIRSFPDDENGSRIMLTTRLSEVAVSAGNGYTFDMPFLNLENSWKLLADKVFGIAGCPLRLESMGKQIAQQCQGLPLSLVVIAGLLPKINRTYKDWKKVLEIMKSHEGSTSEQCLAILALSYNYLPCSLKACFLYMGVFPEDEEIPVDKLIKIWVAEGFLKPSSHKKLEEVAEECLEDLVSRSLIIVSRRRANGKIRSCRIHDLLRQLCLREGKSDKFFHVITKSFEMSAEGMEIEHRLCLHPDGLENQSLGLEKGNFDSVRTILCLGELHSFFNSGCYKIVDPRFELLRVLDVLNIHFPSFPYEITELVQLRYVSFTTGSEVPASISNLWNLQTMVVISVAENELTLPLETWKMSSLRHFNPGRMYMPAPPKAQNFLGLEYLETLHSLRTADSSWKEIFMAVTNVKTLGVLINPDLNEWSNFSDSLICLVNLRKLRIHLALPPYVQFFRRLPAPQWNAFPTKLMHLTLEATHLLWKDMSFLGKLPNLEVLKLKYFAFQGSNWNLNEGGFKKLKLLHIFMTNLVRWKATSDSLPSLECLVLRHCYKLEEIAIEIGDIPTLELIELHHCSHSAATCVEEILEEQKGLGNEILVAHAYNTGVRYFDMRGEVDEEDDIASTYGSDVTYNHMSNMHRKFLTKAREEVVNVEHTSEDINFDVEELACSRWITTCLKYEEKPKQLRLEYGSERVQGDSSTDKLPQGARVVRDLSINLSRRSEEKAKQLILDYAGSECRQGNADLEVNFSPPSSPGSEDIDITLNDRRYRNSSKKSQLYSKLKRLIGQK